MQYTSKKAKRKAEYLERKKRRNWFKQREDRIQESFNKNGSLDEIAKLMGIPLK
jgi:hypothetical protein